jgi:hypothetical protein
MAALPLGVLSAERAGWFVLALLPTALLAGALRARRGAPPAANAALSAAGGAAVYMAVLLVAAGRWRELPLQLHGLLPASVATAVLALACSAVLWRWRARPRSLFA